MHVSDIRVAAFVHAKATLSEDMLIEDVERWFHGQEGVESAVVVDSAGMISGMVVRRRFLHQLSGRFGHALFGQRPIAELMEGDFLLVDESAALPEVAARLSLRKDDQFYDDIVVKFTDGSYGTAPARLVLEAMQNASAQLHNDLASIRDENRKLQNQAETNNRETG